MGCRGVSACARREEKERRRVAPPRREERRGAKGSHAMRSRLTLFGIEGAERRRAPSRRRALKLSENDLDGGHREEILHRRRRRRLGTPPAERHVEVGVDSPSPSGAGGGGSAAAAAAGQCTMRRLAQQPHLPSAPAPASSDARWVGFQRQRSLARAQRERGRSARRREDVRVAVMYDSSELKKGDRKFKFHLKSGEGKLFVLWWEGRARGGLRMRDNIQTGSSGRLWVRPLCRPRQTSRR